MSNFHVFTFLTSILTSLEIYEFEFVLISDVSRNECSIDRAIETEDFTVRFTFTLTRVFHIENTCGLSWLCRAHEEDRNGIRDKPLLNSSCEQMLLYMHHITFRQDKLNVLFHVYIWRFRLKAITYSYNNVQNKL